MPTIENKDIGSWNMSLKEMNETFNERYICTNFSNLQAASSTHFAIKFKY